MNMRPYYAVFAPCLGTVAAFHVSSGARVESGEGIADIEMMKIFVRVEAPASGEIEWVVPLGAVIGEGEMIGKIFP